MKTMALTLCAALIGGAPLALAAESGDAAKPAKTCLFSDRVDGYTKATRDSIVLTSGLDKWRADFASRCTGIDFAMAVGVDSRTTCVTPGDTIKFKESGGLRQTCFISAVTYLPKDEKAAAPASN